MGLVLLDSLRDCIIVSIDGYIPCMHCMSGNKSDMPFKLNISFFFGLISRQPWSWTIYTDHGRPWLAMVDHGRQGAI